MKIITPTRINLSELSNEYENTLLEFLIPFYHTIKDFQFESLNSEVESVPIEISKHNITVKLKYQGARYGIYELALTSKKPFLRHPCLIFIFKNTIKSSDPEESDVVLDVNAQTFTKLPYLCVVRFFMDYLNKIYPEKKADAELAHQWLMNQLTKKILNHPQYVVYTKKNDTLHGSFQWACDNKDMDLMEYLICSPDLVNHINVVDNQEFLSWCENNNQMQFYFQMIVNPYEKKSQFTELSLNF